MNATTSVAAVSGLRTAPVKALTGTAAVALLLAATRWGSYIGVSPLFLTDILIVASVLDRLLGIGLGAAVRPGLRSGFREGVPSLPVALFAYALLRMMGSGEYVGTAVWFRDGAPYLYAALALLACHAFARATPGTTERTMWWVWRALIFHLIWICAVGVIGEQAFLTMPRPLFDAGVFNARPDIDSAVLGITGGLLLRRLLMGRRRLMSVLGLAAVVYGASTFTTRAGFIAVAICSVLGFSYAYVATNSVTLKRAGLAVMALGVLTAAVLWLPSTTVGARLIATVEPTGVSAAASQNAVGTADARIETWRGVISWTGAEQGRMVFGTGMGKDFLAASGTLQYLEGTDYEGVRSPHDYFIGSFARLGLVGLGLIVALCLQLLRRLIVFRRRIASDELLVFSALTVVGILSVASFGVVLEAPFGAVPFWWAAGILLSLVRVPSDGGASPSPAVVQSPAAISA